ncbi:hypothetical protein M011DRAFT_161393 [Sporormia fimetaria CBS 119925]|uniref:Uncharacterized protein n=1 Tax=Sporormia fimetaria CBS 119925 TaxID=1340428 RepID=A0A6A6V6E7_9PLEO|nr:hypothetical protein M011DRAFT_161393 [Sporormia fimetaria CBS 119925]
MYINTDAANRGAIVRAFNEAAIHSARLPPDTNALLEPFVDRAPPPTYLEATTPCLWSSRRSGDEASRLLPSDGRPSPAPPLDDPLDGVYRGPTSDRRRLQDKWARSGVLTCSVAVILTMTLVIATAFVVAHSKDVRLLELEC